MKEYPHILGPNKAPHLPMIAFYKYDGSQIRFSWNRKTGWCKAGTRHCLFDRTDPEYGCAIPLFMEKFGYELEKVFLENKVYRGTQQATVYLEFFGPHSFAGQHNPAILGVESNDPKELILFDVNIHKKGFVSPRDFIRHFGHLHSAQVIYEGNLTDEFIWDIKTGKYPVWEGVVCKGGEGHKLWFRKIKTHAYLGALKKFHGDNWVKYWE